MTDLANAFDFTPSKLAANRNGQLSEEQRAALTVVLSRHLDRKRPLTLVGLAMLATGMGLLVTFALRLINRTPLPGALLLIGLVLLIAGSALLIVRRSSAQPEDLTSYFDDQIRGDRIQPRTGRVQLTSADALLVDEEWVAFLTRPGRSVADVILDDQVYTAYTIEIAGTLVLLSLEEAQPDGVANQSSD